MCNNCILLTELDIIVGFGHMALSELQVGQSARILKVGGSGALRQHFLDMGLLS